MKRSNHVVCQETFESRNSYNDKLVDNDPFVKNFVVCHETIESRNAYNDKLVDNEPFVNSLSTCAVQHVKSFLPQGNSNLSLQCDLVIYRWFFKLFTIFNFRIIHHTVYLFSFTIFFIYNSSYCLSFFIFSKTAHFSRFFRVERSFLDKSNIFMIKRYSNVKKEVF